jgi:protein gp37
LGATFDTANDTSTFRDHLAEIKARGYHTWASAEPLLEDIAPMMDWEDSIDWLVIGAMTGPEAKNRQPQREWVEALVEGAKVHSIPVFMKKNLAGVWQVPLIQELPKEIK